MRCFTTTIAATTLLVFSIVCSDAIEEAEQEDVDAKSSSSLKKSWTLHHSWAAPGAEPNFTRRSRIVLDIDAQQQPSAVELTVENEAACLTEEAVKSMLDAGWYQLKLVEDAAVVEDASASSPSVITTVPSCLLRRANFRDEMVLTFGQNGNIISLTYMPTVSPLAPKSCEDLTMFPTSIPATFDSKISYETAVPGMVLRTILPQYQPPPGLRYLTTKRASSKDGGGLTIGTSTKPPPSLTGDPKDGGKEDAPPPDNSLFGFLKRYWYIVLPLMLSNFISAEPPAQEGEQQQQQQQGGQQQQGQGSTAGQHYQQRAGRAGGTGSGAASTTQRTRRGKRG